MNGLKTLTMNAMGRATKSATCSVRWSATDFEHSSERTTWTQVIDEEAERQRHRDGHRSDGVVRQPPQPLLDEARHGWLSDPAQAKARQRNPDLRPGDIAGEVPDGVLRHARRCFPPTPAPGCGSAVR